MTDQDDGAQQQRDAQMRSEAASIAALTRAARTDGREISAPARAAFLASFETEHTCKHCGTVTIDQSLPPEQRARAAKAAMSAHFRRLASVSRTARYTVDRVAAIADAADEQLRTELELIDEL